MLHVMNFLNSIVSSAESHGEESIFDVVMHHITDHVITDGFIGRINETFLSEKLFGIFDMRITKWVLMLWIAMLLCILIFVPLAHKIKKSPMGSKSRWVNMWEALIGFVHDDIVGANFHGTAASKAMPYFGTLFFFILIANYLGLIPGSATATGNLAVTGALAVFTLLLIFGVGLVKQGPKYLFNGFVPGGLPAPLFPVLWILEFVGILIKPFSLMIRLFANMTAGHIVIIAFIFLVMMFQNAWVGIGSVVGSLMIYLLELLVAFIQAYIFTTLSAMFIADSMHHH